MIKGKLFFIPYSKRSNSRSHFLNNNKLLKCKRSQSEVISTILIILLVIVAAGFLLGFLIPFIRDQLSSGDCFQFNGKIEIKNDPLYTCYDGSTKILYLKVGIGDIDDKSNNKITGLNFVVQNESSSVNYQLTPPDSNPPGISLLNGAVGELPLKNQERTFKIINITTKPNSIIVYPLIDNNRKCSETSSTINFIPDCTNHFMSVNSNDFISGGNIPASFLANPVLTLNDIPDGTQSLAVILEDINTGVINWTEYNISVSGTIATVSPGIGQKIIIPYSAPSEPAHYYNFTVYALNSFITTDPNSESDVINSIKGAKLAQATLYGKVV